MDFSPFKTVSGYGAMLDKIGLSTFVVSLGATWLLRHNIAPLDSAFLRFDLPLSLLGFSIPLSYALPAFFLALSFRMIKMHDRISDLFGIRRRFDVQQILIPMAGEAGIATPLKKIERLVEERRELMNEVFYVYASSSPEKAAIDRQMITMALDQWSWYWMLLEGSVIVLVCAIVLLLAGRAESAAWLFATFILFLAFMHGLMSLCIRYAQGEVKAITQDPARRGHVREVLGAV